MEHDKIIAAAIENGAIDAGIIEIDRDALKPYKKGLMEVLPDVKSVLVMAFKINRDSIGSIHHSITNLEFKSVWTEANECGRDTVLSLNKLGIKAVNIPAGFPFELSRSEGMWLTCDKIFAEEAGLGRMGINRLLLHREYGSGVFLGTVILNAESDRYDSKTDYNPCINCGLCIKVCPTGAVKKDSFNFNSCYTHNYRERLGGFQNWIENIVESKNTKEYRKRVKDSETLSMWQNLSVASQTRCDRCMSVCPAGLKKEEYEADKNSYIEKNVKIFNELPETIYAIKYSDGYFHTLKKFPNKTVKPVSNGMRPQSAQAFLKSVQVAFQPGRSKGLCATYNFEFTGQDNIKGSITIKDEKISVKEGLAENADLKITADSKTWTGILSKEKSLLFAIITGKIKVKGPLKLMKSFSRCFPS